MYWKYKACKTNLPDHLKSGVHLVQTVSLLLSSDQSKTDKLENHTQEEIQSQWNYYKRRYNGDNHWLELDYFMDGTYKLLYAVVKEPKYASVICCVVDKDTNEIHALSDDAVKNQNVESLIKNNKDMNGSKKNAACWYFYLNECKPLKYGPIRTYTADMRMPSYLGLWTKEVVLFDNYEEAAQYCIHVSHQVNVKDYTQLIKKAQNEINKRGTLDDAIQRAIKQATNEWKANNKCQLNNIERFTKVVEDNKQSIIEAPDWIKQL